MTEYEHRSTEVTELQLEMISAEMAMVLRLKTDSQRLRSVDAFWRSARRILKASITSEHPDWDQQQVHHEIARRISNGAVDNVHA